MDDVRPLCSIYTILCYYKLVILAYFLQTEYTECSIQIYLTRYSYRVVSYSMAVTNKPTASPFSSVKRPEITEPRLSIYLSPWHIHTTIVL